MRQDKLSVFITVDTEFYPLAPPLPGVPSDIERDIYGHTAEGQFGLNYQIELLDACGLKACFFVEGLSASATDTRDLARMVATIQRHGHEVQLHLHPEWLAWMPSPPVPSHGRGLLHQFSLGEQTTLISTALRNLRDAGATGVCAFRSGDFAANADTLKALEQSRVLYDTSCNSRYAFSMSDVPGAPDRVHPVRLGKVWELPVAVWRDALGQRRAAQISGCSVRELQHALLAAWQAGWHSFVVVTHTFELLKHRRRRVSRPTSDPMMVQRFRSFCHFLRDNSDKFRTSGFQDCDDLLPNFVQELPRFSPSLSTTLGRVFEQAYRRWF